MRLASLSRWLLVGAIFYAPWAYGCTNYESALGLTVILAITLILWLLSSLGRFNFPKIPWTLLLASLAVLFLGWGMTLNAQFLHDNAHMYFIPLVNLFPNLPGSYDKFLSEAMIWRMTAIVGVIWMISDVSQDAKWRKRIFISMALAGTSIALWGLIQRALGAQAIFFDSHKIRQHGFHFFSTFRYHANAGAYMNLVLPITAGLLLGAMQKRKQHAQRALWGASLVLMLVASLVNTSRGAAFIAGLLLLFFIFWQKKALWHLFKRAGIFVRILILVLGIGAVSTAVMSAKPETTIKRWEKLPDQIETFSNRTPAHKTWLHILPHSGWFGTGPGTFRAVSSYFRHFGGPEVEKFWWKNAHQDYLQFIIEWGYIGAVLWAFIFFGGIALGIRCLLNHKDGSLTSLLAGCACIALIGVAIHAMWDFPLQIASIQFYSAIFLGNLWGTLFQRS